MKAEEMGPLVAMVVVQLGYAGMNIISKVAIQAGMDPFVLVAYRQISATIVTAPFALYLERKTWGTLTKNILFQIFLCSLFGATGNQLLYFVGLKYTTPTIGCALSNTLPAMTFLLAIPFGLEKVKVKSWWGQAKMIGTAVCIGGAMLLSFYHGHVIGIAKSKLHWDYADTVQKTAQQGAASGSSAGSVLGPFLILVSNICWAIWFIIQAKMGESYDAPYTTTALMCLMSAFQCTCAAIIFDHNISGWALMPPIRLIASLYAGFIGSGLSFCLMTWTIQKKGPLYVSVFSPLLLIIVAFVSWALLQEKIYVGTAVGSVLIVMGLYAVLWGKNKETKEQESIGDMSVIKEDQASEVSMDLELQSKPSPNGYHKNITTARP